MDKQAERETDRDECVVAEIGAASDLTKAIGNTSVEQNGQPLFYA